ncbi:MAG: hypothetical protein IJ251_04430 [Oscillospiraceae bacterium]|nr:hypothetical protein [Oscillospiraceae bacterium]
METIDSSRKKQLDHDLIAIGVITFIVLSLVLVVFGKQFNGFVYDTTSPVLPRVAVADSRRTTKRERLCNRIGYAASS